MDALTDHHGRGDVLQVCAGRHLSGAAANYDLQVHGERRRRREVDCHPAGRDFFENGLETTVLEEELEEEREQGLAINRLLQGFMASGLLVGIAALGVISLRAVVERRQQIGVLRAIGYRRGMVLASFLMESSFVALLRHPARRGARSSLLSYNLVNSIGEDIPGLKFTIPWLQIGTIIAIAYAFSLLTTFLPARQASRIYPAEALRYE